MLTEEQKKELETLMDHRKENDERVRIKDVTSILYPVEPSRELVKQT